MSVPTHDTRPRRRRGTGSIDPLPDGRFRPRLPASVGRVRLEPCSTYEEAEAMLDAALAEIAERNVIPVEGVTLRAWGTRWMDDREIGGAEDIKSDRSRWRTHIDPAMFIDWPLAAIRPVHVREWLEEMTRKNAKPGGGQRATMHRKLGKQTIKNTLNLLRCCLETALERELILENPARDVHLPRAKATERRPFDPWTYLMPEEQEALLSCPMIPEEERDLIAFALWTGVRESEQWNIELWDVHVERDRPHVVIRFGKKGKAPKNGRIRRVPLFGLALDATLRQLGRLSDPTRRNANHLLWPTLRGERRQGKAPRHWSEYREVAGLVPERRHDRQRVRWHDLRHTCASSLIAGWRGRRWTLEEVKELLGHGDIGVTQRYAHLAESVLHAAARETEWAGGTGPALAVPGPSWVGRSAYLLPSVAEAEYANR